jgi:hypothetical protein
MAEDPAEEAMRMLREHQEEAGKIFAVPDAPVEAPDKDGVPAWMIRDEELLWPPTSRSPGARKLSTA